MMANTFVKAEVGNWSWCSCAFAEAVVMLVQEVGGVEDVSGWSCLH